MGTKQPPSDRRGRKILPDTEQIVKLHEGGMTDVEISEWWNKHSGINASPSSVSTARWRAGATTDAPRYNHVLPWRIARRHNKHRRARQLRLLGRWLSDRPLTDESTQRVDSFLRDMTATGAVVYYDVNGFHDVDLDESIREGGRQPVVTFEGEEFVIPIIVFRDQELRVSWDELFA